MDFSNLAKMPLDEPLYKLVKSLAGGIYRVDSKAKKILVYTLVHGFSETAASCSRKPPDELLTSSENGLDRGISRNGKNFSVD